MASLKEQVATTLPGRAVNAARRRLAWEWRCRRIQAVPTEEHCARVGMADREEAIGCDLCGERTVQPFLHPRDTRRKRPRWGYHVVRCPSCGFLYRNPGIRPGRLGELYEGEYGRFLTGAYAETRRRRYQLVMDAFHPLFADGAGRRLLDFGCGAGLFLDVAHARGFECYGVDLSEHAIEMARTKPSGAHAYFGAPEDVPEIAVGGFDVITLWSVLAHLATPVRDLTMLRGLLAPGGVLLVLTVNASSRQLKANLGAWNGFTPNHLKFYAPPTLRRLCERAGFGAVVLRPMHPHALETGEITVRPRPRRSRRNPHDNMMQAVAFVDAAGPGRWGL